MPSKNRPANGKGASAFGGHKIKGHRIKNRRHRIKQVWIDRLMLGVAKIDHEGHIYPVDQKPRKD